MWNHVIDSRPTMILRKHYWHPVGLASKQSAKKSELLAGSMHLLEETHQRSKSSVRLDFNTKKMTPATWALAGLAVLVILGLLYKYVALPMMNGIWIICRYDLAKRNPCYIDYQYHRLMIYLKRRQVTLLASTPVPTSIPIGGGNGQIAFASARNSGIPQIFLINTDGTNLVQITSQIDGACQPTWAPDGKRFAFISPCAKLSDDYRGSSIFIMNVDGSGLTPVSITPDGDYDPAWSPDGKKLAFTSLRDGRPHVYVYDLASDVATITFTRIGL